MEGGQRGPASQSRPEGGVGKSVVVGVSVHRQEGTRVPARGPGVVTSWGGKVAAERPDAPPKDACLHLDPLTVKSQLPLKKPLPLTVEHLPDAPVGSVFGLYQSRAGLFSAASITSGVFLSLLDSIYHDCDIAQSQRLPLPREPKLEALHAWLPSLSLASLHPDIPQTTADGGKLSFFDHVSICALGRRRGTTAVYGTDLAWVLKHFSDLEPSIAAQIENDANAAKRESGCPEDHPLPLTKLIAKAIDAGFLRNRVETLRQDRGVANIPAESYLKASDAPDLQKPDKALQSPPPASTDPATMLSGNAGEGATACGGSAAAGQDLISVPRNTFMTLLQTNLDNKPPRQTPLPYAAPLPPFSHQAIATAPSYGPGAGAVAPAGGYQTYTDGACTIVPAMLMGLGVRGDDARMTPGIHGLLLKMLKNWPLCALREDELRFLHLSLYP